jgi:hypothetical protein
MVLVLPVINVRCLAQNDGTAQTKSQSTTVHACDCSQHDIKKYEFHSYLEHKLSYSPGLMFIVPSIQSTLATNPGKQLFIIE